MDDFLQYRYQSSKYDAITLLVISNEIFGNRIAAALKEIHDKGPNNRIFELNIITCETIKHILSITKEEVHVDYILFLLDTRNKLCIYDMERNMTLLQDIFVSGRMCIVNGNSHLPLNELSVPVSMINGLRKKYNLPLLNANILDSEACFRLATRLIKLILDSLGYQQQVPLIPWLLHV